MKHFETEQNWGVNVAALKVVAVLTLNLALLGCSKTEQSGGLPPAPETPQEAAVQVQQVFEQAAPEVQQAAVVASQGMQEGDYEKAVVSLQAISQRSDLTFQQGMAVHNSMVAMEKELIKRKRSGDPNAERAYQMWKNLKRN